MKDHVPDLERCKRMKEMGFPGESTLYWCCHGDHEAYVEYGKVDCELSTGGYPAPIVTELLAELPSSLLGDASMELLQVNPGHDDGWCVGYGWWNCHHADTLPNALADLWLWLRERGE